jgi:transcriptional regulator with GAF, ATPase, and Fis domain
VRSAEGGTLFLDEIGEMPLATQAKLLRVLESAEVRPVGEDSVLKVDVRFVAATNVPLDERVEEGQFRPDLFHRIAALRIPLPPLRERREDIPLLTHHFVTQERSRCTPTVEAMEKLMAWRWPGNVRELRNVVRVALSSAAPDATRFSEEHLSDKVRQGRVESPNDELKSRLEEALSAAQGNVSEAARRLGSRRATVYEQARRLGIDPASFRRG